MPIITRPIPTLTEEDEARFWEKVDHRGRNECWPWLAHRDRQGYGKFRLQGNIEKAQRVSFVLSGREIPNGLLVCHSCDNPPCQNPNHLWAGTNTDNSHDRDKKGRNVSNLGIGDKNWARLHPKRMSRKDNFVKGECGRFLNKASW